MKSSLAIMITLPRDAYYRLTADDVKALHALYEGMYGGQAGDTVRPALHVVCGR